MARIERSIVRISTGVVGDALHAIHLTVVAARRELLTAWVFVPLGVVAVLAACFGVDVAFKRASVSFPASVACLLILFFALLLSERFLGTYKTRKIVAVIDIQAGWSLRFINLFFTPSFILLPLAPSIGIVEVFKIIAVFVIGFIIMMVITAYLTRGLQILTGSSKRAAIERAEELGSTTEEIPMVRMPPSAGPSAEPSRAPSPDPDTGLSPPPPTQAASSSDAIREREEQQQFNDGTKTPVTVSTSMPRQEPLPPTRPQEWAALLTNHLDLAIYSTIFLFIGIPIYYTTGYAMPVQLCLNILAYFVAMMIPARWRQYVHPVPVSSLITVLGIWAMASIRGDSLHTALLAYKTGTGYIQLWEGGQNLRLPGAGDILGTVLDASIVALALPMYQFRRELKEHFFAIIIPNILISIASLFAYPPLCYAIGIGAKRSLAFAARSLTLALATPAVQNLHGDLNTVAAVAIMSGLLGVVIGQRMLAMLRIPEDDYVTRGVTLGANSSAIATALLLRTDPRAAALSSLSMSLFGTITVLFTSIPTISNLVQSLVR